MDCSGLRTHELRHRFKMLRMALEGLSSCSQESRVEPDDIQAVYFEAIRFEKDLESLFTKSADLKLAA